MVDVTINGERYVPAPPVVENPKLLDFRFNDGDLGDVSLREYFQELLIRIWDEGEDFRGKRPFGSSGWAWDLRRAVILAGAVPGVVENGTVVQLDDVDAADRIIRGLMFEMCKAPGG